SGSEWRVVNSGGTVFHTVIWLSRISTSGQILGTSAVQETGQNQYRPAIACAGDGSSQVAWGERHTNLDYLENVRSSYVDAAGNGSPVQDLSNGLRRQTHVQFARNGNEVLAVFVSQGGGTTRILAQRVDASGNPIDAEPVEVASAVETMRYPPAVTWNGTYYLVVWAQGGSVLGRRLNAGAAPVDPAPVTLLTDSASAPAVGAVGSSVLLAYTFTFSGDQNYLKGVRVDLSNMSLIGSPAQIGPGLVIPGVRIADFGGRFFVVYEDQGNHDVVSSVITGVFVGVDGLAQPSIQISPTFDEDMPGLAVSGTGAQALVTWSNQNTYPTSAIEGRIVNADGSFATAPFVIADAAGEQLFTTAAWNGEQYVTAWVDYRYVTGVEQLRGDIFAARIDASGSVLDPGGFPVTDGPLPEDLPQLTSGGAGKVILAYTKMHGPGGPEVQRIGYRVIGADVAGVGDPHGAGFAAWTLGPV
ncbi:MAG: hypothetical protein QUU85_02170, partial [Candidatus Eisenbacteria bacterium]|nr:hypothetical protein [Candidatus Eisenbacteria bacterium]